MCLVDSNGQFYELTTSPDDKLTGTDWHVGKRQYGPDGEHLYATEAASTTAQEQAICDTLPNPLTSLCEGGAP